MTNHWMNWTMLSRTYKLIFGIALLLIVDLIWITSSELTKVNKSSFFMASQRTNINKIFIFYFYSFVTSSYIKMKVSINHFSVRISKRQCLHYICWYWDCWLRGKIRVKWMEIIIHLSTKMLTMRTIFQMGVYWFVIKRLNWQEILSVIGHFVYFFFFFAICRAIQLMFQSKTTKWLKSKVTIRVCEVCASVNWPKWKKCRRMKRTKRWCLGYHIRLV